MLKRASFQSYFLLLLCLSLVLQVSSSMEHYVAGNIQSAWNEWRMPSPSTFISPPWVRKRQSKWQNCLDRWPNGGIVVINTAYKNNHGKSVGRPQPRFTTGDDLRLQRRMFTLGSLYSVSYRRDICAIYGVDITTNRSISLFSEAVQLLSTHAKPL